MKNLVSTEWLLSNLDNGDLRLLDATWHMPAAKRDAFKEYSGKHIKNSIFYVIYTNKRPYLLEFPLPVDINIG